MALKKYSDFAKTSEKKSEDLKPLKENLREVKPIAKKIEPQVLKSVNELVNS